MLATHKETPCAQECAVPAVKELEAAAMNL